MTNLRFYRVPVVAFLTVLFSLSVLAQNTKKVKTSNVDEQAIAKLNQEYVTAIKNDDKKTLERILHDDFIIAGISPNPLSKAEYINLIAKDPTLVDFVLGEQYIIRIHKDTAVQTGTLIIKRNVNGKSVSATRRFMTTLVKTNGRWQGFSNLSMVISQN